MKKSDSFYIRVGGDYACFTDPNLKVERVSYPAMTPSAARGILEAIFWKPAFRWEIRSITILKPIKTLSVMRNEIKDRQSNKPIIIESPKQRQQRVSLILKDVEYIIEAKIALVWKSKRIKAYTEQFERKLKRGAYHHAPCLGTREFAAWLEPTTKEQRKIDIKALPVNNQYIGVMHFDTAFVNSESRQNMRFVRHDLMEGNTAQPPQVCKGYQHHLFFPASIENNQIIVPADKYSEIYELENLDVC